MKYSILTAPIKTQLEPTSSLRKPFKEVTRYTEDATIFDFAKEEDAIAFAQAYLPFDKVMVLPGTRKALEFYANLWAYAGETCKQDTKKLATQLSDSNDWYWDYGQDTVDSLDESMEECEATRTDKDETDDDSLEVGSYVMGKSLLTNQRVSLLVMSDIPDWEDLTPEEQLECITPTSYNKKKATADMGIMFDIHCRRKAGRFAKLYAHWIHYSVASSMFQYRIKSKITHKYRNTIYKFNQWRLKGEHP